MCMLSAVHLPNYLLLKARLLWWLNSFWDNGYWAGDLEEETERGAADDSNIGGWSSKTNMCNDRLL